MNHFVFATTNNRKIQEAKAACDQFGITFDSIRVPIHEIQSIDPMEIGAHKVEQAFAIAQQPIVITDTSWNIPALRGFPGGYMKDVTQWFDAEDFLHLIASKTDKRVAFRETIYYKDSRTVKVFSREYWGEFTDQPRGTGTSIAQVACFSGITMAETQDLGRFTHNPEDYVWYEFAQWFATYTQ